MSETLSKEDRRVQLRRTRTAISLSVRPDGYSRVSKINRRIQTDSPAASRSGFRCATQQAANLPKGSNLALLLLKVISESAFGIKSAFDVKSAFRYHFCYQKRF